MSVISTSYWEPEALRVTEIDSLRGLAALNVVFAHFVAAFLPTLLLGNYPGITSFPQDYSWLHVLQWPGLNVIYNGHFAVMIFFVISGYVLSEKRNADNFRERLRSRLWARFFRLTPLVTVTVTFSYILSYYGLYFNANVTALNSELEWIGQFIPPISFAEFIRIALYKGVVLGDGSLNPPLWTISIELYGSLLIIGFLIVAGNRNIFIKVVAVGAAVLLIAPQNFIYMSCFFAGGLIRLFDLRFKKIHIGILPVALYFASYQYDSMFYSFLPSTKIIGSEKDFYNMLGAVLLFMMTISGKLNFLLLTKPAIFLGRISFALYLTHFIILCSVASLLYLTGLSGWLMLINLSAYLICSILLSIPLTKYIDEPGSRLARNIGQAVEGRKPSPV